MSYRKNMHVQILSYWSTEKESHCTENTGNYVLHDTNAYTGTELTMNLSQERTTGS